MFKNSYFSSNRSYICTTTKGSNCLSLTSLLSLNCPSWIRYTGPSELDKNAWELETGYQLQVIHVQLMLHCCSHPSTIRATTQALSKGRELICKMQLQSGDAMHTGTYREFSTLILSPPSGFPAQQLENHLEKQSASQVKLTEAPMKWSTCALKDVHISKLRKYICWLWVKWALLKVHWKTLCPNVRQK